MKKVIRIKKRNSNTNHQYTSMLPEYHNFIYRNLNLIVNFDECFCVSVSKTFLESLNEVSYSQRPIYRREKGAIDTSFTKAFLMSDHLA